jgi:glycerate 2-kinase
LSAALAAVEPAQAVSHALASRTDLYDAKRVVIVGAGKASAPMAAAVEVFFGERLPIDGVVVVRYGNSAPTRHVRIREAGHPVPDAAGIAATQEIAEQLKGLSEDDLVVCVISGGGSALLMLPAEGISLDDLQTTTNLLLRAGASINELNVVRKHLDRVKGGGLARLAQPARVLTLVLSDVVGNPLDAIASGPTVPDTSSFAEAAAVFDRYRLWDGLPGPVAERVRRGVAGAVPENPRRDDPAFARTETLIVGSNLLACEAAAAKAAELGLASLVLSTYVEGEAREVAHVLAGLLREVDSSGHPLARPCVLVAGGETTVTVRGGGSGGRNQELALAAAFALRDVPDVLLASIGTDGSDGPTDAAGAWVDGSTLQRALDLDLDPRRYLEDNNSYALFDRLGNLIRTGPTNTNVNDVYFLFAF